MAEKKTLILFYSKPVYFMQISRYGPENGWQLCPMGTSNAILKIMPCFHKLQLFVFWYIDDY